MGALITPRTWMRQPDRVTGINQDHPLASSLVFFGFPVDGAVRDLVSGLNAAATGSGCVIERRALNGGTAGPGNNYLLCASNPGATGAWIWPNNKTGAVAALYNGKPVSQFVMGAPLTAGVLTPLISIYDDAQARGFSVASDDWIYAAHGGIAVQTNITGGQATTYSVDGILTTTPQNRMHFFGVGCQNGDTSNTSYAPGGRVGLKTGNTYNPIQQTGQHVGFGCLYNTNRTACSVALGLAFDRYLTAPEWSALYQNPWALAKAPPRRMWVGPASAGAAFDPALFAPSDQRSNTLLRM